MLIKTKYQIIITSLLGNLTEYFSFTLLAIFINPIGQSFFPKSDYVTQVILVFIVFGTGFLSRPIGAIFFGHLGDKKGRKQSLSYTIIGMSSVTFIISVLPGYNSIGVLAPILLTLLRLSQGFFVGGEGPGSALFILEHNKNANKGLIGGTIIASIVSGSFLAVLVGMLVEQCNIQNSWNWRIPFMISSFMGLIVLYLRSHLPETKDFIKITQQSKILTTPIIEVLRYNWKHMILIASLGGITTATSYIIMAYLKYYLETQQNIQHLHALKYSSFSIFTFIVSLLILGSIANKYNPRSFIIFFTYLLILLIIPIFIMLNSSNQFMFALGLIVMPIVTGGICAPAYPYAMEQFNTEVRCTGVGLSYTLGIAIFGGFTPVICSYLVTITNLCYSPALYIIFLSFLYLLCEKYCK